jgi:hypothetical protein
VAFMLVHFFWLQPAATCSSSPLNPRRSPASAAADVAAQLAFRPVSRRQPTAPPEPRPRSLTAGDHTSSPPHRRPGPGHRRAAASESNSGTPGGVARTSRSPIRAI